MKTDNVEFRVGFGVDYHCLVPARKLILGGVAIPYEKGLLGHSDADVLIHSLCDALLGAASLGDIGRHYPPSDMRYKDISSMALLEDVIFKLSQKGWSLNNADLTLVAEKPKIALYVPKMIENIANMCEVEIHRINIKATTSEGMGFTGREEGMTAYSVATIKSA
jgi:2-C-methyl-D-erythritol 2,4-cyclodiphosphate synthase